MPLKKLVIPTFKSEKEEADWWYKNRRIVEADMRQAMREGKTITLADVLAQAKAKSRLSPVTLRLPEADLHTARQLASEKGLGYQTYIKLLLHEALRKEAARQPRR